MNKVLYPGSFDPITKGHMNIVNQVCNLFDEIVIAVLINPSKKNPFFSIEERVEQIKEIYKNNDKVKVVTASGAAVDVATENDCKAIVRGLRGVTDFEDEIARQQINKEISHYKVNTICLFADPNYQFLSSSMVKEVFMLGKDISRYVDDSIKKQMEVKTYGSKNIR